jgi:hypothetical protein
MHLAGVLLDTIGPSYSRQTPGLSDSAIHRSVATRIDAAILENSKRHF